MKKLTILTMFVAITSIMFAQTSSVVSETSLLRGNPAEMRGYAVIDTELDPNLKETVITVTARGANQETLETVFVGELTDDLNYVKLPDEIFEENPQNVTYSISIKGYDANGAVIHDEEQVVGYIYEGPSYNSDKCWECNANDYHYKITFHSKIIDGKNSSTGYLTLDEASSEASKRPKTDYVYITEKDWENFTDTEEKWYAFQKKHKLYHIKNTSGIYPPDISTDDVNKTIIFVDGPYNSSDKYVNYYGQVMTGSAQLYGILKTKGPWHACPLQSKEISGIDSRNDINYAIDMLKKHHIDNYNEDPEICPTLICKQMTTGNITGGCCNGGNGGSGGSGSGGNKIPVSRAEQILRCLEKMEENTINDSNTKWREYFKCVHTGTGNTNTGNGTLAEIPNDNLINNKISDIKIVGLIGGTRGNRRTFNTEAKITELQSRMREDVIKRDLLEETSNNLGSVVAESNTSFTNTASNISRVNPKAVTYPPGLYSVEHTFENGEVLTVPIEFPNGITMDNSIAGLIDVNIYPNPITSAVFNIGFESLLNKEVTAKYYVYADNGSLVYSKDINISDGYSTVNINDMFSSSNTGIINGINTFIHVFEFEDNSLIKVNTKKY